MAAMMIPSSENSHPYPSPLAALKIPNISAQRTTTTNPVLKRTLALIHVIKPSAQLEVPNAVPPLMAPAKLKMTVAAKKIATLDLTL
jgi:hypothetical protein